MSISLLSSWPEPPCEPSPHLHLEYAVRNQEQALIQHRRTTILDYYWKRSLNTLNTHTV